MRNLFLQVHFSINVNNFSLAYFTTTWECEEFLFKSSLKSSICYLNYIYMAFVNKKTQVMSDDLCYNKSNWFIYISRTVLWVHEL